MSRVSVIIPTYNRTSLLHETLASVSAQTYRDYEIVVVDDGSTDDTTRRLADGHSQITYHRIDHGGQGAARNTGLELARGELVAFLDSDDLWSARFLETLTRTLDANSRAGFAYCDYATFNERGLVRPVYLQPHEKIRAGSAGNLFTALLNEDFLCTGTMLIRRACFDSVGGFDPGLPPVEDWDLWLRLARAFDAVYVDEPLAQIRQNPLNPSRQPEIVYAQNLKVLAKLRRDFPAEARRYRLLLRRQTIRFHRALADYYRRQRQPLPALKHVYLMLSSRFP